MNEIVRAEFLFIHPDDSHVVVVVFLRENMRLRMPIILAMLIGVHEHKKVSLLLNHCFGMMQSLHLTIN